MMLLCNRLADMNVVHPAQIERPCSECGELVGIYPTGQASMKRYPDMKIVCTRCRKPVQGDTITSAGTVGELQQEIKDSKPVGRA